MPQAGVKGKAAGAMTKSDGEGNKTKKDPAAIGSRRVSFSL
jgi:hypothetical protein